MSMKKRKIYKDPNSVKLRSDEYLEPLYEKWEIVKVKEECECCEGKGYIEIEENKPIGKPIGYVKRRKGYMEKIFENINEQYAKGIVDSMHYLMRELGLTDVKLKFRRNKKL